MTVKIIPISPEYRENWEKVFRRDSSRDRASVCSGDDAGFKPAPGSRYVVDEPVRVSGIVANPFNGSWFGWVL
jgi:hypothetical protein